MAGLVPRGHVAVGLTDDQVRRIAEIVGVPPEAAGSVMVVMVDPETARRVVRGVPPGHSRRDFVLDPAGKDGNAVPLSKNHAETFGRMLDASPKATK